MPRIMGWLKVSTAAYYNLRKVESLPKEGTDSSEYIFYFLFVYSVAAVIILRDLFSAWGLHFKGGVYG